jgi:hypothetical protein
MQLSDIVYTEPARESIRIAFLSSGPGRPVSSGIFKEETERQNVKPKAIKVTRSLWIIFIYHLLSVQT